MKKKFVALVDDVGSEMYLGLSRTKYISYLIILLPALWLLLSACGGGGGGGGGGTGHP
jgi:hypothetical protein